MDESWLQRDKSAAKAPDAAAADRRAPRQSLMLRADLRLSPDLPVVDVRIRNLSAGGALVACTACPGLGDRVQITIKGIGTIGGSVARTSANTVAISFDQDIDVTKAQTSAPKSAGVQVHHIANPRRPGLGIK